MATAEVQKLLDKYPSLKFDEEKQKVICSATNHEMPPSLIAIESYVNGKKFKRASEKETYNYDQHKPHIVPSSKRKHLHELFCTLTLRHIGRTPDDVERHVNGKRFRRALARWKKCKETGEKFTPRSGGRQRANPSNSDTDSLEGGDNFWSDSSDNDIANGDDDMSDLYPPEDFADSAGIPEHGEDRNGHIKVAGATEDDDSDYDMNVLDNNQQTSAKEPSSSQSVPASQPRAKNKKRKLQKKHKHSSENKNVTQKKKQKIS